MFVHDSLTRWAQRTPDAPAVLDAAGTLSYAQLEHRSRLLAARLQCWVPASSDDTQAPARIALWMAKSNQAVVAIHAVLRAGMTYVPIDPDLPMERVVQVLDDAGCAAVLTDDGDQAARLRALQPARPCDSFDEQLRLATPMASAAVLRTWTCRVGRPAAILFTSGSTGRPKGAVITHGNLALFAGWVVERFALMPADRLASHASLSFDLTFLDLFAAVRGGASVALVPPSSTKSGALLMAFLSRFEPTVWQSVPSVLGLMLAHAQKHGQTDTRLRAVLFAGERMPVPRLVGLMAVFPAATFFNIYGCTETNDSTMYEVPRAPDDVPDPLPIGEVLPHIHTLVLDDAGQPVPPGASGMLWVAGGTVMAGYLRAEQNEGVFRYLKDAHGVSRRYYRTNDQVSLQPDGQLRFGGRADGVVKVGGFRISLQDVEDRIAQHTGVNDVAVLAVPDDRRGHLLVAIVQPQDGVALNSLQMKLHCAAQMPRHMVPHSFVFTPVPLPKSANGKVDKKALAARLEAGPPGRPGLLHSSPLPLTPLCLELP